LDLVQSEIGDYVEETCNRNRESILAEALDPKYSGGVEGKKKDITLLKI
jgi:hypothetical protein